MSIGSFNHFVPRKGGILHVLFMVRVSKPAKGKQVKKSKRPGQQDERSNKDQASLLKRWLRKHYKGRCRIRVIKGTGSGERLDRKESHIARRLIASNDWDVVIVEDLGRIFRRVHAYQFCEHAEDHDTRVIALNDGVDTSQDGWRLSAFFAAMRHEMYNADTGKRIRRSQRGRFESGGMLRCEIFGYLKPKDAERENDLQKDPAAEAIYLEMFQLLEDGATYAEIADWLNDNNIPVGPYCRLSRWDCRMVSRIVHNPILKGERVHNRKMSKRVNKTGRRKVVKAPAEETLVRYCPHLAFFDAKYYDKVIRIADERNAKYRRKGKDGTDTRKNVSRRRTRFPGQCVFCGICGRLFVYGGHGQTNRLMCQGARDHQCWNGITLDGPLAAAMIADAVRREIEALPDFDREYEALLNEQVRAANQALHGEIGRIDLDLETARRQAKNLVNDVKAGNSSEWVRKSLNELEADIGRLEAERDEAERNCVSEVKLPTADELKRLFRDSFRDLAVDSFTFARKIRRLVPRIVVFPVRLCDGGKIELRAKFRLQLATLIRDPAVRGKLAPTLEREIEVDAFELPQREQFRTQIVAMRAAGITERIVARKLGLTITATQAAAALQRLMDAIGISTPYVMIASPPEDYPKLSRHKHPRYEFKPLDDAGQL